MIVENNGKGIPRKDGKHFNRKRKHLYIDILFPDFEKFKNATKTEALQIMAEQTLRGTKKYLPTVKGFEADKFCNDMEQLFVKKQLIKI